MTLIYNFSHRVKKFGLILAFAVILCLPACDQETPSDTRPSDKQTNNGPVTNYHGKPATPATISYLKQAEKNLPNGDFLDGSLMSDHSRDQLIAKLPATVGTIKFDDFSFIKSPRPQSLHPSLYQIVQDSYEATGLYKIAEGLYQIRGDIAYITLLRGITGWIVIDPGMTQEFSEQAWKFVHPLLPGGIDVPISAVIYSHSHVDHFGGVRGLLSQTQIDSGKVEIIAPFGFMDEALAENVIVGDAMLRRAQYQFGAFLSTKDDGSEFASLGVALAASLGTFTLIAPTRTLDEGQGKTSLTEVDGIPMEFKDISDAEAPAATIIYLPSLNTIFNSELMYRGMHNIYTLRGAKVRDALAWSKIINEVIHQWGDTVETMIGPHGPSFSGNEKIVEFMKLQRDNYGFIHNQTVRLINNGVKLQDVGQAIEEMVPQSLSQVWHTHGYHGTYSHNARGVVNRYLGFYDANPANLNPMQIKPEAEKYVEYMGGSAAIMQKAVVDFEQGNYRFVATVIDKLVTAQPNNWPARHLLADAYEQLGYQAESPQWRNPYLSAAKELRIGRIQEPKNRGRSNDLLAAATIENLLDSIAVRINSTRAEGKELSLMFVIPDTGENYFIELMNGNLSYIKLEKPIEADTKLTINRDVLLKLMSGDLSALELVKLGVASVEGSILSLVSLLRLIDKNARYYDVVPMPD